jgi:thioredoxin reductase
VDYDVIIVGAGPAGLSAALILGRCRRQVLVLDTGRPRNAASHAMHGFLSRDGIQPAEFRRIARQQLTQYRSVKFARNEATAACQVKEGFEVTVADGKRLRCRKLLLATGVVDELPPVDGIGAFYGRSVFHCPYCDGWESRDQPIAVYSKSANGIGLALELTVWSKDIVLCTDGARLDAKQVARLRDHKIPWRRDPIARLEGVGGRLRRLVFENGESLTRHVMFFSMGQRQSSTLAHQLGCGFTPRGAVRTGEYEVSDIHGVYVAGDASRQVQLAIVAAAEGAQAAFAINMALISEDLAR